MKGILIEISGIDGSGKTTLLNNLETHYISRLPILCTAIFKEPIFTNELEAIAKRLSISRRECFSSSLRAVIWLDDLINTFLQEIEPALKNDKLVLIDRFTLCNEVYSMFSSDHKINHMFKVYDILPKPDLTIYLDVSIENAVKRVASRKEPLQPYEYTEGFLQLKSLFLDKISNFKSPIQIINADLPENKVLKKAIDEIDNVVNTKGSA